MASELKKELILSASDDIKKYLDEKFCIDVDEYDIAELININIGWIFSIVEECLNERK